MDFSIEEFELHCKYLIYSNIIWEFIIRKIGRVWEGCLVIIIHEVKCVLYRHFFKNWILWRGVIIYAASSFIQVIWHVRPTQDRTIYWVHTVERVHFVDDCINRSVSLEFTWNNICSARTEMSLLSIRPRAKLLLFLSRVWTY